MKTQFFKLQTKIKAPEYVMRVSTKFVLKKVKKNPPNSRRKNKSSPLQLYVICVLSI
jgi:hypothetical protein